MFFSNGMLNEIAIDHPRHIAVTANMASATWNTVGTHEVFVVTGLVRLQIWVEVVTAPSSSGEGASLQFGFAISMGEILGTSYETNFTNGGIWCRPASGGTSILGRTFIGTDNEMVEDWVDSDDDVGYEIFTEALISGNIVFHCIWSPLSAGASVTAGAGGSL